MLMADLYTGLSFFSVLNLDQKTTGHKEKITVKPATVSTSV